jgi:hypothetical protein
MRPDRIIVGEALELVQSVISGHPGSLATIHASDPSRPCCARTAQAADLGAAVPGRRPGPDRDVDPPGGTPRPGQRRDAAGRFDRRDGRSRHPTGQFLVRELFRFRTSGQAPDNYPSGRLESTGAVPSFAAESDAPALRSAPTAGDSHARKANGTDDLDS